MAASGISYTLDLGIDGFQLIQYTRWKDKGQTRRRSDSVAGTLKAHELSLPQATRFYTDRRLYLPATPLAIISILQNIIFCATCNRFLIVCTLQNPNLQVT
ncbi:hypothetical protein PoB_003602500 [Plakobranchus ocellatus]|uniref:Uncharacterized protein n=1 Tax=Plakobranchus ocellatus TaxID=259542 RepID=A0AAV4AMS1_9GAST|nr:hypothetical protein PoB_003602500 [Plakobranchus ocellatus]